MNQSPINQLLLSITQRKERLHLVTVSLYLFPLIFFIAITVWLTSPSASWPLVPIGLFLASTCSLIVLTLWRFREGILAAIKTPAPISDASESKIETHFEADDSEDKILKFQQSLEEYRKEQVRCQHELDEKNDSLERLMQENTLLHSTLDGAREKHQRETQNYLEQIQQQKVLLEEYQLTINRQRQELNKNEQHIASQENRLRDLTYQLRDQKYEIKTLLQLADIHPENSAVHNPEPDEWQEDTLPPPPAPIRQQQYEADTTEEHFISTTGEASLLLRRCLDIARKITAPSYYSPSHSPFGHPSPSSHNLDLRRLCDSLRSERGAVILLYSPKEDKLLFVSPSIKLLTGWSAEKWAQEFPGILNEQAHDWRNAVRRLTVQGESILQLQLPAKDHAPARVQAALGTVPTGLFRLHVIAILHPC